MHFIEQDILIQKILARKIQQPSKTCLEYINRSNMAYYCNNSMHHTRKYVELMPLLITMRFKWKCALLPVIQHFVALYCWYMIVSVCNYLCKITETKKFCSMFHKLHAFPSKVAYVRVPQINQMYVIGYILARHLYNNQVCYVTFILICILL